MGNHTERDVFSLTHQLILGWPATFNMHGSCDCHTAMTMFYVNAPAEGFLKLHKFQSLQNDHLEFCSLDFPFFTLAHLPGKPVDPFMWMQTGNLHTRIAPIRLGDVRMKVEYTGLVPKGMKPGARMRLVMWFMGMRE